MSSEPVDYEVLKKEVTKYWDPTEKKDYYHHNRCVSFTTKIEKKFKSKFLGGYFSSYFFELSVAATYFILWYGDANIVLFLHRNKFTDTCEDLVRILMKLIKDDPKAEKRIKEMFFDLDSDSDSDSDQGEEDAGQEEQEYPEPGFDGTPSTIEEAVQMWWEATENYDYYAFDAVFYELERQLDKEKDENMETIHYIRDNLMGFPYPVSILFVLCELSIEEMGFFKEQGINSGSSHEDFHTVLEIAWNQIRPLSQKKLQKNLHLTNEIVSGFNKGGETTNSFNSQQVLGLLKQVLGNQKIIMEKLNGGGGRDYYSDSSDY